jgi:hypothetical protein
MNFGTVSRPQVPHARDDDDAAVVLAVLFAIAGATDAAPEAPLAPSIWGNPAHRIGTDPAPTATAWWASGMPR